MGTVSTHANADQLAVVWDVFFEEQFRPMGRNEGTMTYKLKDVFAPAAAEVQSRLPAAMQKTPQSTNWRPVEDFNAEFLYLQKQWALGKTKYRDLKRKHDVRSWTAKGQTGISGDEATDMAVGDLHEHGHQGDLHISV